MNSFTRRERRAMVAAMRAAGPDAPTLCAGWAVRDLAAHIVLRERRPDVAAGYFVAALAERTRRLQDGLAGGDWEDLLDRVESGPAIYLPMRWLDPVANIAEFFVHTEDVRRATPGWEPRELTASDRGLLWRTVGAFASLVRRSTPVDLVLRPADGRPDKPLAAGRPRGSGVVSVEGPPEELLLWVVGREQARVALEGPEESLALLNGHRRRI